MDPSLEPYLQQLNSPGTVDIRNLFVYSKDLRSGQKSVKQLTINGFTKWYLCCVFKHPCQYYGNCYMIPMELIIPQQFPRDVPYLYIRPERGSKILPIPGYVDASGCVICNVVANLQFRTSMDQLLYTLDQRFSMTLPICADPRAKLVDDCVSLFHQEFTELYDSKKSVFDTVSKKIEDIRSTENEIQTNIPQVQASVSALEKKKQELQDMNTELTSLEQKLEKRQNLGENYRNAFQFKNDSQRLYLELDAVEKSHLEINNYLSASLCKSNMDEIVDLIRENAKQQYEARYLKQVVKAKAEASTY